MKHSKRVEGPARAQADLAHYHMERAHQGLGNERIEESGPRGTGDVECHERLGGILKNYRRAA